MNIVRLWCPAATATIRRSNRRLGAAHQILVPERHRIEGAGVDGGELSDGGQDALLDAGGPAAQFSGPPRRAAARKCTEPAAPLRCLREPVRVAIVLVQGADPTRHRRTRRARRAAPPRQAPARRGPHRTADRETPGRSMRVRCAPSTRARRRLRCCTCVACKRCCVTRIAAASCASCSSSTTCAAPRDAASKPSAPVPANASRQRQPLRSCPSQLNSVSRTRSIVGRSPGFVGDRQLAALPLRRR